MLADADRNLTVFRSGGGLVDVTVELFDAIGRLLVDAARGGEMVIAGAEMLGDLALCRHGSCKRLNFFAG